MKWFSIFIFICLSIKSISQKNDYTWIIGGSSVNFIKFGYQWGTAIADFKEEPVVFRYEEKITMDLGGTNTIVSDAAGHLQMYSNGMHVHHFLHRDIAGLDTISYSPHWENFNYPEYLPDGSDWKSGLSGNQWILMLPAPGSNVDYYIFHPYVENTKGPLYLAHLLETKVRFDHLNPNGKLIYKERKVSDGTFQWGLTAVRHGNGQDWWLMHSSLYNDFFEIYILDQNGLRPYQQETNIYRSNHRRTYHQACFSPSGDRYVIAEGLELSDTMRIAIYDFDRCSGRLSKNDSIIKTGRNILYGSVSFSADGKYLYYTDGLKMYQCDMDAADILASEVEVAEYDGSISEYYKEKLIFSKMGLGPDGRIYCIPNGNTRSIHTIEYPEEHGSESKMVQNKITLPIQNFNSLPNVPHYRLGPEDGSPCDTLGLNNMPVAKFRFEQDTSDHLRLRFTDLSYFRAETWTWDFADGTTFSGRKPYWHRFPAEGNYKVCLTVSNENGQNTYCKTIQIGATVNTSDVGNSDGKVNIFPNPAEYDLMVTLSDYVPALGQIFIYDLMGREVLNHKIYYGQNSVDISTLPAGSYIYKVKDGAKHLGEGKFVKRE